MTTAELKRNFWQTAIYNFFALFLGVTPPAPGQELLYLSLVLAAIALIAFGGYFAVRMLMSQMLG